MRNLTDVHNQLSAADRVHLEKRAEQIKIAEEEDAAGRIMARGFADELASLNKVADEGYGNIINRPGAKTGEGYGPRKPKAGGPSQMQQRSMTSANAAQQAGGSSVNTVGAPGMGRRSSQQPNAAPKPMGGGMAGAPKPPGGAPRPPVVAGGGALPRPGKMP